jgi:hypothetical protein
LQGLFLIYYFTSELKQKQKPIFIMKQKTKERVLFNQFLKEYDCIKQFVQNFRKDTEFESIRELFEEEKPKDILVTAFHWGYAKETPQYWAEIDRQWERLITNQN